MAILNLLDVCHESNHPLPSPPDEELVPDFHFWLDAKPCTDSQQALHSVPSVCVQTAQSQLCITWPNKECRLRVLGVRCSQAHPCEDGLAVPTRLRHLSLSMMQSAILNDAYYVKHGACAESTRYSLLGCCPGC